MALLSRTAILLLMLPVPAAVYLGASMQDVSASAQCLPSGDAVRFLYPGTFAAWTTHAPDHRGEKCWFPVTRETHAHQTEALLRRAALHREAQRLQNETASGDKVDVQHPAGQGDKVQGDKVQKERPVAFMAVMDELGWFRGRSGGVARGSGAVAWVEGAAQGSSFADRFSAAGDVGSSRRTSAMQNMIDPVGAVTKIR